MGQIMKIAPTVFLPSKLCREDESQTIALLIKYSQILYGLNVENLPVELWEAAFLSILERFKGINIQDIQNAFRIAQIEKKQYISLTRDELLKPISEYWTQKINLIQEIEKIKNQSEEEKKRVDLDRQFKEKAKEKYIEGLQSGIWSGDEFEANSIARNFAHCFKQEQKNEFVLRAKNEFFRRKQELEDDKTINKELAILPPWEKIYARIFIEECLKRQIKFIHP